MKTGISWLDVKLGLRMLAKHPGLTLIGGLGMAVAIAIGAISFQTFYTLMSPTLPLDEGDRVVGVESWDAAWNNQERQILHDFVAWREEVKTVRDLGAYRDVRRNLIVPGAQAEAVSIAEMTASGFRVARVSPLLGRYLVPEDEREGAPPVVVIGHDVWQTRFAGDLAVVGRTLQLGSARYTVVGVMPEGFGFPLNHRLWTPLRVDPADYERRRGPSIFVFGRLAPGATVEQAGAEMETIGRRAAAAFPGTHARLRPRVVPYTAQYFDDASRWELHLTQLMVSMLLVVICANVAVLVYARTATRTGEITVRSALGASRRRIVMQLFVEALVLSTGAAVVGLLLAWLALRPVNNLFSTQLGGIPFWADYGLSSGTVLYALGLAVLGAAIVGAVPALKATGRGLDSTLRQLGGGTGMQLGKTWTALIVVQVAFAVAILPAGLSMGWQLIRVGASEPAFPAEEYLAVRLGMERETPPSAQAEAYDREYAARFGALQAELERRLEAEPGVSHVSAVVHLPGGEPEVAIEVEGAAPRAEGTPRHRAGIAPVDPGFFAAFEVPLLAGRTFTPADQDATATAVVVNRAFVQQVLGGGNALGRRVREVNVVDDDQVGAEAPGAPQPGPWYEVVGVVGDLAPVGMEPGETEARVYFPLAPGRGAPVNLAVRLRGSAPESFTPRLREIAAVLDPALRLQRALPLDEIYRQQQSVIRLGAVALGGVAASVLLLSAAGIYALMSFIVARRRREIGIRSALGADPRRILQSVFSRALGQLAVGVVLGGAVAVPLATSVQDDARASLPWLLPAVAALMLVVGLLAALGPARRGLRIQPSEALRADG